MSEIPSTPNGYRRVDALVCYGPQCRVRLCLPLRISETYLVQPHKNAIQIALQDKVLSSLWNKSKLVDRFDMKLGGSWPGVLHGHLQKQYWVSIQNLSKQPKKLLICRHTFADPGRLFGLGQGFGGGAYRLRARLQGF